MDQAGIVCYTCNAGVFMHRSFWNFAPCPGCKGRDPFCGYCHGRNVVATPREDIDAAELQAYRAWVVLRHQKFEHDLPAPVASFGTSVLG